MKHKFYEIKDYSQMLVFDDNDWLVKEKCSCTCKWGSYYGQSKKNKGKLCRHLQQALDEYQYEIENTEAGNP